MNLLKLIIVDDERVQLKGLALTYDWKSLGFNLVGTALSGEEAIALIQEKKPDVVLTDIRMKKVSGLDVMKEIKGQGLSCLFVVLSAYRDFEYAQSACNLGAFDYLLKPIETDKLTETMGKAYRKVMEDKETSQEINGLKTLILDDKNGFIPVLVERFVKDEAEEEKVRNAFRTAMPEIDDLTLFFTVCADLDLGLKITEPKEYEKRKGLLEERLEAEISKTHECLTFRNDYGSPTCLVVAKEAADVRRLGTRIEAACSDREICYSISSSFRGFAGMKKSYEEACSVLENKLLANDSFDTDDNSDNKISAGSETDRILSIVHAMNRKDTVLMKQSFVCLLYGMDEDAHSQKEVLHHLILEVELNCKARGKLSEDLRESFLGFYTNLKEISPSKAVDVAFKLCQKALEEDETSDNCMNDYMKTALDYIETHLDDENLSVVSVAEQVYLNPVYFGRMFKNSYHDTFKKYVLSRRMEKAKKLLTESSLNIGDICSSVGINNPSYFSHLFKSYTGVLPSEYMKGGAL